MKQILVLAILAAFSSLGCQLAPTKMYQVHKVDTRALEASAGKRLDIDSETVVLDSRSAFDYSMAHIPGSINVAWQDFTNSKSGVAGLLKDDKFRMARRLSTYGISPVSKVIIIGRGPSGEGEGGRLAWTLFYLGVKNVQFVDLSYFRKIRLSNVSEAPPKKNASMWKPKVLESVDADRSEVVELVGTKQTDRKSFVVDVRESKEYLGRMGSDGKGDAHNLGAINIPWKEFFDSRGRPNLKLRAKLLELGLKQNSRVIVVSDKGVRSAAATMSLFSMGFANAANYSGGFQGLKAGSGKYFR